MSDCYPATRRAVPLARRAAGAFAARAGADEAQLQAVRLAVTEAVTNAVIHAYEGAAGTIRLNAGAAGGELWILIADDGIGLHPRLDSPGLGLGLALIAHVADDLSIVRRSSGGTELRMRFDLPVRQDRSDPQSRGSVASASDPASSRLSTTT